jgi:predicted RecB family nuclease
MRLVASDFVTYYRPEPCAGRVFLRSKGEPEAEPSDFDRVLRELGLRHEQEHLATLGPYLDLQGMPEDERVRATFEAVLNRTPVLYQAALTANTKLDGTDVTVVGFPDYLLLDSSSYIVRDSKLSRHIDTDDHIEIVLQVQLYGWLFEKTFGHTPYKLQVHNGQNQLVDVPYDGGSKALAELERITAIKKLADRPYEPVGWSKCSACGYGERCWQEAEERKDPALLPEVDQGLARALYGAGIRCHADLLEKFDAPTLSEFKRPWGSGMARVGKKAEKILRYAEVTETGEEKLIALPKLPPSTNLVMFDLEGIPPFQDELERIFLWGLQVFGDSATGYLGAVAGFGDEGDKQAWFEFLSFAKQMFEQYGDIPFVHWATYEKTYITKYIERYGDPEGVAARVLRNLFDLLPVTRNSIALPIPSYSLKVLEEYVGFQRTQTEYGGEWAMATFIQATETRDESKRQELMNAILKYNEEDLAATWAVFQWLRGKAASAPAP